MTPTGNDLLAEALRRERTEFLFFLMGAPILDAAQRCAAAGIRIIDVRHEQAAAMMAHAAARVLARPAVCLAAAGPGVVNLASGLANARVDGAPVVALGGASPIAEWETGAFQDMDQLALMRPVTKWSARVHEARRIPEYVHRAFAEARSGTPGPVYLDLPGDVLYATVEDKAATWRQRPAVEAVAKAAAPAGAVASLVTLLRHASRPIVLAGSGVLWAQAAPELRRFVAAAGVPCYTTPQARGVVPEDGPAMFPGARSFAFREADFVLVVGTRLNYVVGFGRPPRFAADATFVRIDINAETLACDTRSTLGLVGDAKTVLDQVLEATRWELDPDRYGAWREQLAATEAERRATQARWLDSDQVPIHPLRLCREIGAFIGRDAILIADGQEILHYARQSLPGFVPGHRLNPGPFGTMGVGVPFAIGAKAAKPEAEVVVLHGDGSFGLNAMELDTAIRHRLPVLIVISLNGGWTAAADDPRSGRDLGQTRYDRLAEALGCHGELVERPEAIRPALERARQAIAAGRTAVLNVVTESRARAETSAYATYRT
jgi:acetolactate synthase-1/2/3 large subunit